MKNFRVVFFFVGLVGIFSWSGYCVAAQAPREIVSGIDLLVEIERDTVDVVYTNVKSQGTAFIVRQLNKCMLDYERLDEIGKIIIQQYVLVMSRDVCADDEFWNIPDEGDIYEAFDELIENLLVTERIPFPLYWFLVEIYDRLVQLAMKRREDFHLGFILYHSDHLGGHHEMEAVQEQPAALREHAVEEQPQRAHELRASESRRTLFAVASVVGVIAGMWYYRTHYLCRADKQALTKTVRI